MRQFALVAVLFASALWCADTRLAAQKQQQIFLSLADPSGAPVSDLKAEDVIVSEDGVECKTLKLEPVDWPMKLQLLVDNGPATTMQINSMREGLRGFFDQIPAGIEMTLLTTAPNPRTIVKPTTDKQKLLDGINLIAPDRSAGMFFDALFEATGRIDKDKAPNFPIIVAIGSDFGRDGGNDRDFQRMQESLQKHAATVHVVMVSADATSTKAGSQVEVGLAATKLTGGKYENINAATRLATLLPEIGKRVAQSQARQSHQYRITYERPANPKPMPQVGVSVHRDGTPSLSLDGHVP